jgi:hypothetical protein
VSKCKPKGITVRPHEVLATLAGRQTQLCRLVKPQSAVFEDLDGFKPGERVAYPQGPFAPGQRLFFKEVYHPAGRLCQEYLIEYKADSSERTVDAGFEGPSPAMDSAISRNSWLSPVTMPKWASRIAVEICSVKVERLGDISAEDCIAEGISADTVNEAGMHWRLETWNSRERRHLKDLYIMIWDSINGSGAYERDLALWVWRAKFRRVG